MGQNTLVLVGWASKETRLSVQTEFFETVIQVFSFCSFSF